MSSEPLKFEAELTLRAQIQVRAEHPVAGGKVFLKQHERSWTYRQFRDESTRMAHLLLRRLGRIDDQRPGLARDIPAAGALNQGGGVMQTVARPREGRTAELQGARRRWI